MTGYFIIFLFDNRQGDDQTPGCRFEPFRLVRRPACPPRQVALLVALTHRNTGELPAERLRPQIDFASPEGIDDNRLLTGMPEYPGALWHRKCSEGGPNKLWHLVTESPKEV
jgi:hypothetical protein